MILPVCNPFPLKKFYPKFSIAFMECTFLPPLEEMRINLNNFLGK